MKCIRCGKEMRNTIGGNYVCDNCGCAVNDLVYREYKTITPSNNLDPSVIDNNIVYPGNSDNPNYHFWGSQGWICPKCGAVLSPSTIFCPFCAPGNSNTTVTTNGTTYTVNSTPGSSITINKENKKYD